jgi:Helix-turn-helix domain of transposase family ISL3
VIINDAQTFLALFEGVGECRVALEAAYGWEWLADVLQDAGYELHLAHPMRSAGATWTWAPAAASSSVGCGCCAARTAPVRMEPVPWARAGAQHTRDFDDVVAWLAQQMAKTQIAALLRIGWDSVGRIVSACWATTATSAVSTGW